MISQGSICGTPILKHGSHISRKCATQSCPNNLLIILSLVVNGPFSIFGGWWWMECELPPQLWVGSSFRYMVGISPGNVLGRSGQL